MKPARIILVVAATLGVNGCMTAPQTPAQTAGGAVIEAMSGSGMSGAVASAMIQNPGLVAILMQQLGITSAQAMGGAGSIFAMAQGMMTPNNFGIISKSVPNMDALLAAAPKISPNAMGATGALRGTGIGNVATLASSFKSLGMGPGMVNQFIPVVLQYMQTQGGPSAMGLLQSAILP